MTIIRNSKMLTPIEEHHGLFFKRDDLYLPFNDYSNLGGGKVRQMQELIENMKYNNEEINGLITQPVSFSSPQCAIVAKVAKENNLPCIICIGGGIKNIDETINKNKPLKYSREFGAEILHVANAGYSSILKNKITEISNNNKYKIVDFGINLLQYPRAIIESIANQVENIPNDIDNLIIPCGSGISMAGIIIGLVKFNKNVKRIIGIQISNIDRTNRINEILKSFNVIREYEFIIDNTYNYSKNIEYYINSKFDLNVKYESKAFKYFLKNKHNLNINDTDKNLIWIIGNNNFLFS